MAYQSKQKWTVFFLIKSIDGSIGDAIEMINGIRRDVDACAYISVVFCLNVLKKNIKAIEMGDISLEVENEDPARTTVFYSLTKSKGANPEFKSDLGYIDRKDDFDITDPESIKGFFKDNILKKYKADRYILFTWDHGNGYGIFSDKPEPPPVQVTRLAMEVVPIQKTNLLTPAVVSNVTKNNVNAVAVDKVLTMDELASALGNAFGKEKIDVVIMLNCYMQFFDSGYALRKNVKYLIAPESYIYFKGYNYEFIFRKLTNEPGLSSRKMAKHVVESFELKLYEDQSVGFTAKATTALFANDVSCYSQFAEYINQLAGALEKELIESKPELIMARVSTPPVNGASHLVDFFYLLQNLQKSLGKNWQQELVKKLLILKKKAIVAQYIGFDFSNNMGSANPSGFSVYFPIKQIGQVASKKAFDLFKDSSFRRDKTWHALVDKFV